VQKKIKKIKGEKKKLLKYIIRSQKAILRNTTLLKQLEREDEISNCDILPGFEEIQKLCKKETIVKRKKLLRYLVRSQKAQCRNTKKLKKLENEYRKLISPSLIILNDFV